MDLNGVLWFGTQSGVSRFDGFSWETYDVSDGLVNNVVTFITSDSDGALWFGTREGISKFKDRTTSVSDLRSLNHIDFFGIKAVYPNPFNPSTTISYSIAEQGHVKLSVYNLAGQKITTLVDSSMPAGTHQATFDGSDLASGMYFYRFETNNFATNGKMMIVK